MVVLCEEEKNRAGSDVTLGKTGAFVAAGRIRTLWVLYFQIELTAFAW